MISTEPISVNPKVMSGTPVFAGTRVPVKNLVYYLKGGHTLDEFLEAFPTVEREQAQTVLDLALRLLLSQAA